MKTAPYNISGPRALQRARTRLGLPPDARLDAAQTSVWLKYLLIDALGEPRGHAPDATQQGQLATDLDRLTQTLPAALPAQTLNALSWGLPLQALKTSARYRQRLLDLAAEALWSHPLAPEICLAPQPLAPPPGHHRHALIFAAPLIAHELYPLAVDAFVRDSRQYGGPRHVLLAARQDWLTHAGQLQRVIHTDWDSGQLCEGDLATPLAPDSAQFLALEPDEATLHAALSARLPCPQVNPYAAARLADDKTAAGQAWQSVGVPTPATQKLAMLDAAQIPAIMQQWHGAVVKPNGGTQSQGVAFIAQAQDLAALHATADPALLVQQRRDGLAYRDPASGRLHSLVLRLNAAFDGTAWKVESAHARLGPHIDAPAGSPGSRNADLQAVLPHLVRRRDRLPCPPPADWSARLLPAAQRAAAVFQGLWLIGLDVVLEPDADGHPTPVFLEANSRPLGLGRSTLLDSTLLDKGERGVTQVLWDGLERLGNIPRPMKPRSAAHAATAPT